MTKDQRDERVFFTSIGFLSGLIVAIGIALGTDMAQIKWSWIEYVLDFAGIPLSLSGFMWSLSSVSQPSNLENGAK